jgi:hypothetical protein
MCENEQKNLSIFVQGVGGLKCLCGADLRHVGLG